jgi:hypothetical protein
MNDDVEWRQLGKNELPEKFSQPALESISINS